jgi:hypothetical protein
VRIPGTGERQTGFVEGDPEETVCPAALTCSNKNTAEKSITFKSTYRIVHVCTFMCALIV